MRLMKSMVLVVAFAAMLTGAVERLEAASDKRVLLKVEVKDETALYELTSSGIVIYARLYTARGPVYLVGASPLQAEALLAGPSDVAELDSDTEGRRYYVVYRMPRFAPEDLGAYGRVLHEDDIQAVMEMSPAAAQRLSEAGAELRAVTFDPKPAGALPESALPTGVTDGHLAPEAIAPDPLIQQMVDQVDSATVYQYAGDLSGEWPVTVGGSPYTIATRYTYSGDPIDKATQFAGEHLEALGLPVEYHQWGDPTCPNVIAELPGTGSPDSIVIICAHIDDLPLGSLAPGADDNASGSVAVLIAADILSRYDWHYTLRFALWTGEEEGLLGSYAYARRSFNLGEKIVGVLNLDMIAYNTPGSAPDIDLYANPGLPGTLVIAQLFADAVSAYGLDLVPEVINNGMGSSDHACFTQYGYDAILGIEDLSDFNPHYHTTGDQLQYVDMDFYVEFVKASVATTAHMAGPQGPPDPLPSLRAPAFLSLALLLLLLGLRSRRVPEPGT